MAAPSPGRGRARRRGERVGAGMGAELGSGGRAGSGLEPVAGAGGSWRGACRDGRGLAGAAADGVGPGRDPVGRSGPRRAAPGCRAPGQRLAASALLSGRAGGGATCAELGHAWQVCMSVHPEWRRGGRGGHRCWPGRCAHPEESDQPLLLLCEQFAHCRHQRSAALRAARALLAVLTQASWGGECSAMYITETAQPLRAKNVISV